MKHQRTISLSATIHPSADVSDVCVGPNVKVQQYAVIQSGSVIGDHTIVEPHCVIEESVTIGDHVTLKSGVHLGRRSRIESGVLVGPNSVLTGCSEGHPACIREGASIGANVTIIAGVEVGQNAQVVDGSVVTADVPPGALVSGNPATIQGYREATDIKSRSLKIRQPQVAGIAGVELLPLRQVHDLRGTLTVCQWDQQLPFAPKRVFFLHGVPSEKVRGAHAHKQCAQVLVCINGTVSVLVDDGKSREEHVLNSSDEGLLISPGIWATQYQYSSNAMLVVFASENYAADDYIRDYDEFLRYRRSAIDSAA